MKKLIIIIFSFLLISCNHKKKNISSDDKKTTQNLGVDEKTEIEKWIFQKVTLTLKENDIPALSIGIIQNGKISMLEGFGVYKRDNQRQIGKNSIFQIGSLSKMYTGIIANNLISEKVLKLEESIINYLPMSLSNEVKEKLKPIQIIDLLHHRTGIPRNSMVIDRIDGNPMLGGYSVEDLLKDLELIRLESKPNTNFEYSNIGYAILGYICENVSKTTYSELLKKYISDKYQLRNTILDLSDMDILVTPYRKDDRSIETKPWKTEKLTPASGIYSDINDISNLMKLQLNAYQQYEKYKTVTPLILTEHVGSRNSENNFYGFGIYKSVGKTRTVYGLGGDIDGFAGEYSFSVKHNCGVVLLTSSGGRWIKVLAYEVLRKLEEES